EGRDRSLALAGFLFGLAIWDKALAIWTISGIGIAGLLIFPREILRAVTARRVAIAALAFALGALPLIVYNVDSRGGTFKGNFERNTRDVPGKAAFLIRSLSSDGLFAWMTADDWQTPQPHQPGTTVEKLTARISAIGGH